MGAKEAAKQTAALERDSGPAAAAVGDTRLWECAQMLPAPGNAPTGGAGSAGGQGNAQGEPGLRGPVDPLHVPSVGEHLCLHPPHAAPLCHHLGSFITGQRGRGWAGTPRRGPHGCPPCFRAAPSIPHPCANTGHRQVRGEGDALRCAAASPEAKRKRVTVPKVPHPWMKLSSPLFSLQTAHC